MAADGSKVRPMPCIAFFGDASWSAAGRYVDFSGARPALAFVARSGRRARRLPTPPGPVLSPAISPDGSRIAYLRSRTARNVRLDLYTSERSGRDVRRLTTSGDVTGDPAWSTRGQIAFVRSDSGKRGDGRIFVTPVNGGGTRFVAYGSDPAWSPDASEIVYIGREHDLRRISVGEGESLCVGLGGHEPVWSSDGHWIAFTAPAVACVETVCPHRIHVVRASGGRSRTVGPILSESSSLAWMRAGPGG